MQIKRLTAALAAALLGASAQASYFYWQVNPAEDGTYGTLYAKDGDTLKAWDASTGTWSDGGEGTLYAAEGGGIGGETGIKADLETLGGASGDLSAYSFFVEMTSYKQAGEIYEITQSRSWEWAYSWMASEGYITTDALAVPGTAIVNFGTAAPEPTSGLLLLLGASALALKRRRVVSEP